MEIREVPRGERAPEGSDHITINKLANGKCGFTGNRKMGNVDHHAVSPNSFDSEDEALAAARGWAEENGVETLYVVWPDA